MSARTARALGWTALACALVGCARTGLHEYEADAARASDVLAASDAGASVSARNACGGDAGLPGAPGDECAPCSRWRCRGSDALVCEPYATPNACGACGPLPDEECNGRDDNCDGRVDEGCVLRLTALRETAAHPRISGERVAMDVRGRGTNASDAALVTFGDGAARFLSPHSDPPGMSVDPSQDSETTITGDAVAWVSRRVDPLWNGGRIVRMDLATGESRNVSERRGRHPDIGADGRIAFEAVGTSDYDWDVWVWDPARGTAAALTDARADEHSPEIDGDRVVFNRGTSGSPIAGVAIVLYDLRTRTERVLSEGLAGYQVDPAIDGDRVVWRQNDLTTASTQQGVLWLYDLRTGERARLDADGFASDPRIDGALVCWHTLSGHPGGLTVMDLTTGRRRVLSREGHHCDVQGRRVVWLEGASATDVYYRELLPDEP